MWPFQKQRTKTIKQLLSVSLLEDGLTLATAFPGGDSQSSLKTPFEISQVKYIPCESISKQEYQLSKFVIENNLQTTPCAFVLQPKDYRLFLLDSPNVPEDELKQSAKWLVKDLIDYSLDDVAVDVFPAPTREGQKPKIFISVTRKSYLETISGIAKAVGLDLVKIDIVELAYRNLLMLANDADKGIVLLFSTAENTHILILKGDTIYLTRRLENVSSHAEIFSEPKEMPEPKPTPNQVDEKQPLSFEAIGVNSSEKKLNLLKNLNGSLSEPSAEKKAQSNHEENDGYVSFSSEAVQPEVAAPSDSQFCDSLARELLRSIDFYQGQLAQAMPVKILLDPELARNKKLRDCVKSTIDIPCEEIKFEEFFKFAEKSAEADMQKCATVISESFFLQEIITGE